MLPAGHGGSWLCQRCSSCCAQFLGLHSSGLHWHYLYGENSVSVLESAEATCWKLCFCLCPVWVTRAGVLATRVSVSSHEPQTFALDYRRQIIIISCDVTLSLNFVSLLCMYCSLSSRRMLQSHLISASPRWMAVVSSSEPRLFVAAPLLLRTVWTWLSVWPFIDRYIQALNICDIRSSTVAQAKGCLDVCFSLSVCSDHSQYFILTAAEQQISVLRELAVRVCNV